MSALPPTLTIRPRQPTDVPLCASLLARVYHQDGYPVQGVSNAIEFLSSPSTIAAWVAVETATPSSTPKIIGHVSLTSPPPTSSDPAVVLWRSQHPSKPIAVLERLFVDPEARGLGLAGKLMGAVSGEGETLGLRVVLFGLDKDQGAMRLYERIGWTEFGRSSFGYVDAEGKQREMGCGCFVSPERA